jgi:hypothetical protein
LKLINVFGSIYWWYGVDVNEVEKLILFPATSPWIEDGSAGELGIESTAVRRTRNRTLSQEVRVVARSSEKLKVLSFTFLPFVISFYYSAP